jgi:carboxylate-amine ligase
VEEEFQIVDLATRRLTGQADKLMASLPASRFSQVTADPRYEHIRGEYRILVREQLICSTQVHVDVDDRDLAIAVGRRVAPWLPALSASSPFWLGTETGYVSYRTLIWRRWPTAGRYRPNGTDLS